MHCIRMVRKAFLGLHKQMDKRLQHSSDGGGLLSPLLQYFVYGIVELDAAQDCGAIAELRGHTDEFFGQSRDPTTTDQGYAA